MKVSTKGTYGLKAMVDLALNSREEYITLKSISERQKISERYLEQIFAMLKKSELVRSIKGAQGGYSLSRDMSNITVGEILRALEGQLFSVNEVDEKDEENKMDYCLQRFVWEKINESIIDVVDSVTLEELSTQYRKINNSCDNMYYI